MENTSLKNELEQVTKEYIKAKALFKGVTGNNIISRSIRRSRFNEARSLLSRKRELERKLSPRKNLLKVA